MKKISSILFFTILMVFEIAAQQPMVFMKNPLYIYPDSTIVYNILGGDKYGQKVVTIQNPDKSYTIGVVMDPNDSLTIENIRQSSDTVCPLASNFVIGSMFDSVGNYEERVFYGVKESQLTEKVPLTDANFTTGREWHCVYRGNDYYITFGANGTGTCSSTITENGFAVQCVSGNARGSNQYQTRYKNYGASGGITGGYSFSIEAFVRYKIQWSIKNGHLYVKRLPNPTIQSQKIYTSMDGSNQQKTPSMTEKQWVRVDLKHNYDVAQAKQKLQYELEKIETPLIDSDISGYTEGIVIYWPGNGSWSVLKDSGTKENTPWESIYNEVFQLMTKCSSGLQYQIPKVNFVRNHYKEIGEYFFDGLVDKNLNLFFSPAIDNWLNQCKFSYLMQHNSNNRYLDVDALKRKIEGLKKITNVTNCDSMEYAVLQYNSNTENEYLRLKLYFIITTKKGSRYLTDVCVDFSNDHCQSPIRGENNEHIGLCLESSLTILEEI